MSPLIARDPIDSGIGAFTFVNPCSRIFGENWHLCGVRHISANIMIRCSN